MNIIGFLLICTGIIFVLILHSGYKDADTGFRYRKVEHYFKQEMNPIIKSALESTPDSIDLSQANKGSTVKLEIYFSNASGKAYLQLFEYIPYNYEPCSKMYEYEMGRIEKILTLHP